MLSENWKILLGYKTERNVTKHSLNRARVLLFWEAKLHVLRYICDKQHLNRQPPPVNYMTVYNMSMGLQNPMFRTPVYCFFPDFVSAQNVVRVIEVKLYRKDLRGNKSGRFELSRVRVTEGKITVNVRRKSNGNRFWFELARGSSYRESTVASQVVRGTQRDILRKRPKNNSKAWIKLCESILSILGDCWEKCICSSLSARLMEEFPASKVHLQLATWLTGTFHSRRMSR